ncbi:MAG: methyltransferase [Gammaproteobacteria bacterium]
MKQSEELTIFSGQFSLERLPKIQKNKLRAWDAADELILTYLHEQKLLSNLINPVLLVNDAFGALAIALHEIERHSWSDSLLSHQATTENLQRNNIQAENYQPVQSIDPLPATYDLVLIKIPKTLALLEYQLSQLKPHISVNTTIIAAGMSKHIHTSTLNYFEKIIGATTTSLATKKARLIYSQHNQQAAAKIGYPKTIIDEALDLQLSNHANVFSKDSLDIGARFMIEQMQQYLPEQRNCQHIIDLGCGNGVLGIIAKRLQPQAHISFIDESYMAIDSAKTNFNQNIQSDQNRSDASFLTNDCLEKWNNKADLILCNPPFHQAHSIGDQIAWKMFRQSKDQLNKGGELWIIGNRHLAYHSKLKRLFGNCQTLASNKKFVVLKAY